MFQANQSANTPVISEANKLKWNSNKYNKEVAIRNAIYSNDPEYLKNVLNVVYPPSQYSNLRDVLETDSSLDYIQAIDNTGLYPINNVQEEYNQALLKGDQDYITYLEKKYNLTRPLTSRPTGYFQKLFKEINRYESSETLKMYIDGILKYDRSLYAKFLRMYMYQIEHVGELVIPPQSVLPTVITREWLWSLINFNPQEYWLVDIKFPDNDDLEEIGDFLPNSSGFSFQPLTSEDPRYEFFRNGCILKVTTQEETGMFFEELKDLNTDDENYKILPFDNEVAFDTVNVDQVIDVLMKLNPFFILEWFIIAFSGRDFTRTNPSELWNYNLNRTQFNAAFDYLQNLSALLASYSSKESTVLSPKTLSPSQQLQQLSLSSSSSSSSFQPLSPSKQVNNVQQNIFQPMFNVQQTQL
jgi:hypothetical protein